MMKNNYTRDGENAKGIILNCILNNGCELRKNNVETNLEGQTEIAHDRRIIYSGDKAKLNNMSLTDLF